MERLRPRPIARQRSDALRAEIAAGMSDVLPAQETLAELLGITDADALTAVFNRALFNPIAELADNRGKRLRAQLLALCHGLVADQRLPNLFARRRCKLAAEVVELVHLGSLIVDDIEDGSRVRRGRPALHLQYGTPLALNAGNWLYFWPAELLRRMELTERERAAAYERYNRTLLRAHFGQAADLGCQADNLPQAAVPAACLSMMELKTGALMGFAAALGAITAGAPGRLVSIFDDFGKNLGAALQMFDDLGNVIGRCEPLKRFEDLLMKRLCWVWACAAKISSEKEYGRFIAAVQDLPDDAALQRWMAERDFTSYIRRSARGHLEGALLQLETALKKNRSAWPRATFDELRRLGEEIANAYD
jgi:geranylgeranyl pyrophosphate synthase